MVTFKDALVIFTIYEDFGREMLTYGDKGNAGL